MVHPDPQADPQAPRSAPPAAVAVAAVATLIVLVIAAGCAATGPAAGTVVDVVQLGYRGHVEARPADADAGRLHRAVRDARPVRALELDLRPDAAGFAGRVEVVVVRGAGLITLWNEPIDGAARCRFPLPEGTTPVLLRLRATRGAADYALAPTERTPRPGEPTGCRAAR